MVMKHIVMVFNYFFGKKQTNKQTLVTIKKYFEKHFKILNFEIFIPIAEIKEIKINIKIKLFCVCRFQNPLSSISYFIPTSL